MFKRAISQIIILLTCCLTAVGLPSHKFTQYTSEDGLEENVIQNILQDQRGLMWFATWNGLYSFDGYRFHRYGTGSNGVEPSNPRLDQLAEDPNGRLWMLTYDGLVYRFDPVAKQFEQITNDKYRVEKLTLMSDGLAWMVTRQADLLLADAGASQITILDFFASHGLRKPTRINALHLDEEGRHWILTENGAFLYHPAQGQVSVVTSQPTYGIVMHDSICYMGSRDGQLLTMTLHERSPRTLPLATRSSLKALSWLPQGQLLACTATDGFFLFNPKTGEMRHVTTTQCAALGSNQIQDLYMDGFGDLWLRTDQIGVVHYVPQTGACRHFALSDVYGQPIVESRFDQIVVEDINHQLWIHPSGGGLAWYNRETDELEPFYNPNLQNRWSNANKLTALYSDIQGNLWFGSYGNGLEKASFGLYPFFLESYDRQALDFAGNNVRSVLQDRDGFIWAGGKDRVIRVYDSHYRFVGNLCRNGEVRSDRIETLGLAYCMLQSRDGTLWIGTKGDGLLMLTLKNEAAKGVSLSFTLRQYQNSDDNIYSLSSNEVYSLYEDHNDRIWLATFQNGVNVMERGKDGTPRRFYSTRNQLTTYPLIACYRSRFVTGDDQGNIWIGTTGGLLTCREDFPEPSQILFRRYHRRSDEPQTLPCDDVHGIYQTREGRRFICTFGSGVCEMWLAQDGTATFERFSGRQEGESSDVLLSMQQDASGHLWCSAEDGLCRLDLQSGLFTNYRSRLFPTRFTINEGQAIALQNGELLFNTTRGLLHFHPDSVDIGGFEPPIRFGKDSLLLLPGQHTLVAQFAALDYVSPEAINYAYRLDGFETEWHYVGSQHTATYTNLPPGKYELEVRSTNSGGFWVDNVQSLAVEVQPTFGETTLATVLRLLLVMAVLVGIIVIALVIYRLRHQVAIEEQLTDMKLKFFTNVSHELRTPLTLITGPLEHLLQREELTDELKEQLGIVWNNASKMSKLVSQILDFRKIQKGKMQLTVENIDLVTFVQSQVSDFRLLAETMQIGLEYEPRVEHLPVWADADKLGQVVTNLLSNAFKYSQAGHPIVVTVETDKGKAILSVRDYGVGMTSEKIKSLYERFGSRVRQTPSGMESTGIGLSLTKELVDMHHGQITVHSRPGVGSCFRVLLPLGREHFGADTEFVVGRDTAAVQVSVSRPLSMTVTSPTEETDLTEEVMTGATLLIVEDNDELRHFICQVFGDRYRVLEARDGREGLKLAREEMPDLVVSDVMMPELDGFGLAETMRRETELSHIPLILLTALADTDNKLHGLRAGIDDYLTKPFSASYLRARVENILKKRLLLQRYYQQRLSALVAPNMTAQQNADTSSSADSMTIPQVLLSEVDHRFVEQVTRHLKEHLADADYSVDDMAEASNMSRSAFGKKFKSLLGQTPADLLRDLRMKRAAELLDAGGLNVAQICYEVGYNDPHYFGKCFKNYYGMTATEWKEKRESGK